MSGPLLALILAACSGTPDAPSTPPSDGPPTPELVGTWSIEAQPEEARLIDGFVAGLRPGDPLPDDPEAARVARHLRDLAARHPDHDEVRAAQAVVRALETPSLRFTDDRLVLLTSPERPTFSWSWEARTDRGGQVALVDAEGRRSLREVVWIGPDRMSWRSRTATAGDALRLTRVD